MAGSTRRKERQKWKAAASTVSIAAVTASARAVIELDLKYYRPCV